MPELPEVETVVRQLAPLVGGQVLRTLELCDPRLELSRAELERLAGRRIVQVCRLGKQVVFALAAAGPDRVWLSVHLRMTGRLRWYATGEVPAGPPYLRARFTLERGELLFLDARRFGTLRLHRSPREAEPAGIDPLCPAFTPEALAELLAAGDQEIKPWLLRQDRLVGLGNIYASEILHRVGLCPRRRTGSLSPDEVRRLFAATRQVLGEAIEHCGTTFSTFADALGQNGSFQAFLAVYRREGEPCRRCGTSVRRIVQQGRSTFFCPRCQPPG